MRAPRALVILLALCALALVGCDESNSPTAPVAHTASFSAQVTSFDLTWQVDFRNDSREPSGAPIGLGYTCSWNFGDGASGAGCQDQTHLYSRAGSYRVSLTVFDEQGQPVTADRTITLE